VSSTYPVAWELLEGSLVRFAGGAAPAGGGAGSGGVLGGPAPTAVLLHGLLGRRDNLRDFARRLLREHPAWRILLVDLPCHGAAAGHAATTTSAGAGASVTFGCGSAESVASAARAVLGLLGELGAYPSLVVGHSLGGKVALAMAETFAAGAAGKTAAGGARGRLPRAAEVWVLDALPGSPRAGLDPVESSLWGDAGRAGWGPSGRTPEAGAGVPGGLALADALQATSESRAEAGDHPRRLLTALRAAPVPVPGRTWLRERLLSDGFSDAVARWATTSLREAGRGGLDAQGRPCSIHGGVPGAGGTVVAGAGAPWAKSPRCLGWGVDLVGAASLFSSYETDDLWPFVESIAPRVDNLSLHFVRAGRSVMRWGGDDAERLAAAGAEVLVLEKAGHWVHADDPAGLAGLMSSAFAAHGPVGVR